MDLSPNAVVAGRYRVERKVGAGGMGEVWAGEHVAIGVRVAVKRLLPAASVNHEVVARFRREAYLLGRIRSDYVARVLDFVSDENYGLVLVMEFIEGSPLVRVLQERTIGVEEAIDLAFDMASAIKDLHQASIIHRDLKPGNIILQPLANGRRRAVLVDFGVSRQMADANTTDDEELTGITRVDMAVGTIEYMAPEQILNSRNVTPASDIYAAGAILYRAIAGRHVYGNTGSDAELAQKKLTTDAPRLELQRADPPASVLIDVVARMLRRRPSERYKTAEEILEDLAPIRLDGRTMPTTRMEVARTSMASSPDSRRSRAEAPTNNHAATHASPQKQLTVPGVRRQSLTEPSPVASTVAPAERPKRQARAPLIIMAASVAAVLTFGIIAGPSLLDLARGTRPADAVARDAGQAVAQAAEDPDYLDEMTEVAAAASSPPLRAPSAAASVEPVQREAAAPSVAGPAPQASSAPAARGSASR
jgi:serine/threonine-protein kinase